MLKYCIEKGKDLRRGRSFASLVRNAAWLCNLNFKQVNSLKSSPVYSMFKLIEIRTCNKRAFVFAGSLSRKYSFFFSLVEFYKSKCNVVFFKMHKECKTNVMWSSIVVVVPFGFFKSWMNTDKGFHFLNNQ